jgi:glycosyltransferase involved in cell wall biosynthesis
MACGVPVITSNISSLPEVAGDAALTLPPQDVDALYRALHRLITEPDLCATLSQKGQDRAKEFSWPETARQTARIYRRALGE